MATIILTSCNNAFDAELIQGNLANEGIESIISNENYTSLYPNMNGAMCSGIQILIEEKDAERALQIINAMEPKVACPKCGSEDIKQKIDKSFWGRMGVLLLGLISSAPVGNMQVKYRCNHCEHVFVL